MGIMLSIASTSAILALRLRSGTSESSDAMAMKAKRVARKGVAIHSPMNAKMPKNPKKKDTASSVPEAALSAMSKESNPSAQPARRIAEPHRASFSLKTPSQPRRGGSSDALDSWGALSAWGALGVCGCCGSLGRCGSMVGWSMALSFVGVVFT